MPPISILQPGPAPDPHGVASAGASLGAISVDEMNTEAREEPSHASMKPTGPGGVEVVNLIVYLLTTHMLFLKFLIFFLFSHSFFSPFLTKDPAATSIHGATDSGSSDSSGSERGFPGERALPSTVTGFEVPDRFQLNVHCYPETSWRKVVGILGNFNRGKTWFLSKLCGARLPEEGNAIHTFGLGWKCALPDLKGGSGFMAIDSEGMQTPIRSM
jgi:hypothetical protein